MLSIIGIAAIAIFSYLLGHLAGKRAAYVEMVALAESALDAEVDDFVEAQRLNALNQ